MHLANRLGIPILAALAASSALGDTIHEGFDAAGTKPDSTKWSLRSTFGPKGAAATTIGVTQQSSALRFQGRGGGSQCQTKSKFDWNDSFRVSFQCEINDADFILPGDIARVGVALSYDGLKAFSHSAGCSNGVQLEFRTNQSGTQVVLVSRLAGQTVAESEATWIADGFHEAVLFWYADAATETISVQAFLDGVDTTPIAVLEGLPDAFAAEDAAKKPIRATLFAGATAGGFIRGEFDSFDFAGDFRVKGDRDDAEWCDPDGHDDEPIPPSPGASNSLIDVMWAMSAADIMVTQPFMPISVRVSDSAVTMLSYESSTKVRAMVYDRNAGFISSNSLRDASSSERAALALVTTPQTCVPCQDIMVALYVADQGQQITSCVLDAAAGQWKMRLASDLGQPFDRNIPANGLDHGDGNTSISFVRWIMLYARVTDDYPGGVVLSSAMAGGLCEFVLSPAGNPWQLVVARYQWGDLQRVSAATRAPTADEAAVMPYLGFEQASPVYQEYLQFMAGVAIRKTEFRLLGGQPKSRLTYLDAGGVERLRDF